MSVLRLALLGAPVVLHGERSIQFPTRKALALLVYLALETGAHQRDKLTSLFWSESDAEQGRASLRGTLAYIRRALRSGDTNMNDANHLDAERENVRLIVEHDFETDVGALDTVLKSVRQMRYAAPAPNQKLRLEQLRVAAQSVRGEFLEGFSLSDAPEFDDWVTLERELWHRKASDVFDVLSEWQFEGGELAFALETAQRWVALDGFNEVAHRHLMEIYLALGARAPALRAYEAYCAMLKRELNAEPAPETRALAERARTQTPIAVEAFEMKPPQEAEVALVGRRAEHIALVNAFRAARRGHAQIVLVEGEPGIGKTRLCFEFLKWAAAQGAHTLRGRAFETSARLPYQPLATALRAELERRDDLETLVTPVWWAELIRLLPELQDRLPGLGASGAMNEAEARPRLFEAVARLLLGFAARAPVILSIDDVPWADASALDLLGYAVRRWHDEQAPVMLLCTARSEDLAVRDADSPGLEQWFASLGRDVPLTRLVLGGLDREATAQLAYSFGVDPQADNAAGFLERVFAETRGQPFFVLEVLKSFAESGSMERTPEGKWSPAEHAGRGPFAGQDAFLPPGLRGLIEARLARLSRDARELCNAGAVLGDGFTLTTAARLVGLGESETLHALEETLQRGLVREGGEHYFFAHDKIRQAVYRDTSGARRRALHRRALDIVQSEGAPPAECARHAFAAGLNEEAYVLLVEAGNAAMRLFAMRSAIIYYEQALTLREGEMSLLESLGRAYELVNNWASARGVYERLLGYARSAGDAAAECIALNHLATIAAQGFFELPRALGLLQEATEAATRSGQDMRRAETEWSSSQIFFYVWELDRAQTHAERALALARSLENTDLAARSLNILAYIAAVSYAPVEEVRAQANASRALFAQLGNRAMEVECLTIIAIALVFSGFPNETLATGQEGYAIAREIENPWGQANCAYPMVFALIELGKHDEALDLARVGVEAARAAGHPPILVFNLSALGRAFRARGDFESARQAHLEANAIAERLHHPFVGELGALDLCADHAAAGEWQAAYPYARAALALRKYERLYPGFTFALETETLVRAGETDAADADVSRFGAHIRANVRAQMQYLAARAIVAKARGDLSAAEAHGRAAHALATELGLSEERLAT